MPQEESKKGQGQVPNIIDNSNIAGKINEITLKQKPPHIAFLPYEVVFFERTLSNADVRVFYEIMATAIEATQDTDNKIEKMTPLDLGEPARENSVLSPKRR